MNRTIVHAGGKREEPDKDDPYREKLLKYVPAEVLGAFIPLMVAAAAAFDEGDRWHDRVLWIGLIAGAIGTVGYLARNASTRPRARRPLMHFYVLALVAFVAWALATSEPARDVVGVSAKLAEFAVALVIFLIPLADWALAALIRKLQESNPALQDSWILRP